MVYFCLKDPGNDLSLLRSMYWVLQNLSAKSNLRLWNNYIKVKKQTNNNNQQTNNNKKIKTINGTAFFLHVWMGCIWLEAAWKKIVLTIISSGWNNYQKNWKMFWWYLREHISSTCLQVWILFDVQQICLEQAVLVMQLIHSSAHPQSCAYSSIISRQIRQYRALDKAVYVSLI